MKKRCVAFIGNDKQGFLVAGNVELNMNEAISSMTEIKEIQDCIKSHMNLNNCAVINIIDFEEGK